jgi:enoyl-[acyl-carrier protein] reductase I
VYQTHTNTPLTPSEQVATSKRYRALSGYSIQEVVDKVKVDFGSVDYVVHSLANGPEVTKPLLETSREGYLAASSSSAYSLVSMVSRFGPIINTGGAVISLTYIASEKVYIICIKPTPSIL